MSATVEQLFTEVGRSVHRRDADAKMRGEAEFAGDVEVPRMLHGKVLRSEVAHARIARIDASEAEAMAGVVCVMTGSDLGGIDPYYGHALKDRPLLALDRVRFVGEPVAAVAAETEAAAEAALYAIVVEYEPLPVVGTLEEALADDAPRLHDEPLRAGLFHGLGPLEEEAGNVCYRYRLDSGSVEGAGAEAEIEVEGEYVFPAVYQYAMETHTVVCDFREDAITLWASCQHPFLVRAEIADLFGKPLNFRTSDRAVPRRRIRLEVVHEDGADHRRAGAPRRPAGPDPEQRRGVDAHHAPPRHARVDANPRARRRHAPLTRGPLRPRHGRVRGQRATRLRNRR